ncbi:cytochrome c oxidase assembly protein [Gordonia soli]|uniref:Copper resistance protein D domain-containing protein n=1 Tax=Gordonia soli NBRC 108243 TaxID=1223545 RepID=M0QKI6_9ACTN|nr:cytochrome c oxidase assembly protein [Gordonia soli]GAC69073.1 hypothetical protein GS4_20_01380 [Gordonia soli NBRC 108243]
MTSATPTAPADPGRDSMREQPGVVAGLGWVLTWLAAIVAVGVTVLSASTALELAGVPDPGAATTYGLPIVTAIGQVSISIAVGATIFAAFFVPPQQDGFLDVGGYRAMRVASTAALVWAACAVLLVPLSVSNVSGQPLTSALSPSNLITSIGQVADARSWLWTALFAVLAAVATRVSLRWGMTFVGIFFAVLSLMPMALAGHSSTGGNHDLATNSLILHIVGATVWLGGLVAVLTYALAGGRWRALAVRRFSRVAFWCIVVVGISGVINSMVRVPLGDLFTDIYGQLVLAKLAALIVLGALGAWHRRSTIASLDADVDSVGRSAFVRYGLIEALVFAVTFGIAVGLSRTPPPAGESADLTAVESQVGYRIDAPPTFGRILGDWRFDLLFGTAAIVLAAVYLCGVLRLRKRGDEWPIGRTVSWVLGCAALLFATSSGLGRYSPGMFSIHMISHMMMSMLVPVLLVMGGPVTLALRALSPAGRGNPPGPREWIQSAIHSPVSRFLTHPAIAAVLFVGSFYVLYLGGLFDSVIQYHAAHIVMNLHFLLSGYLFYWIVIGIDPAPRQVSPVAKLGIVWGSLPFHAFFGVALMMTSAVIAETYYRNLHLPWNYSLFDDQRVGGGIAWAAGEVPLVIIMLALLIQWRKQDMKQARRFDRRADRDHDADLENYNEMLRSLNKRG